MKASGIQERGFYVLRPEQQADFRAAEYDRLGAHTGKLCVDLQ